MTLSDIYKQTYEKEYKNQPKWKQLAIDEELKKDSSALVDEFVRGVIQKAESHFESAMKNKK